MEKKDDRPIRFRWEAAWIEDPELPSHLRLLLFALAHHMNRDGECWPGKTTLAREMAITTRQLTNVLREARSCGWLEIEVGGGPKTRGGRTTLYTARFRERGETEFPTSEPKVGKFATEVGKSTTESREADFPRIVGRVHKNKTPGDEVSELCCSDLLKALFPEADGEVIQSLMRLPGLDPAEVAWLRTHFLEEPHGLLGEAEPGAYSEEVLKALSDLRWYSRAGFVSFLASKIAFAEHNVDGRRSSGHGDLPELAQELFLKPDEAFDVDGIPPREVYERIVALLDGRRPT